MLTGQQIEQSLLEKKSNHGDVSVYMLINDSWFRFTASSQICPKWSFKFSFHMNVNINLWVGHTAGFVDCIPMIVMFFPMIMIVAYNSFFMVSLVGGLEHLLFFHSVENNPN